MAETIYSVEQISSWQSELKNFAKTPRTRFSKKQAVEAMIDEIEEALRDHPYEEVAEKLKTLGLDISKGLLKKYVNAYRQGNEAEAKRVNHKRPSSKNNQRKKTTERKVNPEKDDGSSDSSTGNGRPAEKETLQTKSSKSRFIEMPEDL